MILPSLYHLQKFLETLELRDEDDLVTITMSLADLRTLAQGQLTEHSLTPYTSSDADRS